MNFDFLTVGNGPTGSQAAYYASKTHETAIVGQGSRRVQCAGLISLSGLKRISMAEGGFILNKVRGAKIHSPGGIVIEVDGRRPVAYAVDRLAFDEALFNRAVDAGAKPIEGRVVALKNGVTLDDGTKIAAKKIAVATGSDYTLQIQEGIERPNDFLVGGQYEMAIECSPDFVELHFCVPDLFAWIIPIGDRARIGLAVRGNPRPRLDAFVKSLGKRVKSDRILAESFGVIPIHKPNIRTQYPGLITVGDAAGQVKATTGGGIVYGCIAAEHATEEDYEQAWRREIGQDLKLHLMIHNLVRRMSDRNKDRFAQLIRDKQSILETEGDMDCAKKTVGAFLKDPVFVAKTLINLPFLLSDVI